MELEIWKDITGYEGHYQVSSLGRVKSLERIVLRKNGELHYSSKGKILLSAMDRYGYLKCCLSIDGLKNNYFIHRLVTTTFIPNPDHKSTVNHKNGIRNDNRLQNLEWATPSENNLHSFRELGRVPYMLGKKGGLSPMFGRRGKDSHMFGRVGKLNGYSKHTQQLDINGKIIGEFESAHIASRITNISISSISSCCNGKIAKAGGYIWRYKDK